MKSPAFRFYPADFMGSPDVQAMDLHEVGAYVYLLCTSWLSERHGYLIDDDEKLRRWARMSREQWTQSRETLLAKFPVVEHGWRANSRMVIEAEKQAAFSEAQSAKGKLGGRPKKAQIKPGVSGEKPELPSGISPEKPSVSVSVFASVSALEAVSGAEEKNQDIPAPPEPPDAVLSGAVLLKPQIVSISSSSKGKRKRDPGPVGGYHPEFLRAYEAYPKHEEKSESQVEWEKAVRRLKNGEMDKPPMTDGQACKFLQQAATSVFEKAKREGTETKYIRSMRRWLLHSTYLDYSSQPAVEYLEMSQEDASTAWERDFGTHV